MLKQTAGNLYERRAAALAAPRQVWLAGLGAAVMTRDWARSDARPMFRALVKEGSSVESRVIRVLGRRLESSITLATSAWKRARRSARSTVNAMVETAAAKLPAFKLAVAAKPAAAPKAVRKTRAKKARATKARTSRRVRRAKRAA
jgi:hypothetical protein